MKDIHTFQLNPPIQLRAGFTGDGASKKPFFFDCAACGAKEPPIAGVHANRGAEGGQLDFANIAILTDGPRGSRHALYCAACFARILGENNSVADAEAPVTPQQQTQTTTTDTESMTTPAPAATAAPKPATKTRTVLFTKELDRKNAVRFQEVAVEGQAPICGTLYLQRWFCGVVQNVRLTIELQ